MLSDNPKSGFYEADTSRTLDLNGGNPCCNQGGVAVVEGADEPEGQTAAVDCRNLRETDEVSGTLLAKAASGGYSLNYQNPVRTGLCVRRLTPHRGGAFAGLPGRLDGGRRGRQSHQRHEALPDARQQRGRPLCGIYHAGHP